MSDKMSFEQLREKVCKEVEAAKAQANDYEGLKIKYRVFKAEDNTPVENCFVLRPDKDPAAIMALEAYAIFTDNAQLSHDIMEWVNKIEGNNGGQT